VLVPASFETQSGHLPASVQESCSHSKDITGFLMLYLGFFATWKKEKKFVNKV
jgi:hypothetical protein